MKRLIMLGILLTGCSSSELVNNVPEFDWMPSDLLWQHNVRDCRSDSHCEAADLFQRT